MILALLCSVLTHPGGAEATEKTSPCSLGLCGESSQDPSRGVGIDPRPGAALPLERGFVDDAGRAVRFGDCLEGRPAVLAFVYYRCPMLCSELQSGLLRSLRALSFEPGRDFTFVAVSIAPEETPALATEAKAAFLARYGRKGAVRFLVGGAPSIAALAGASGFRFRAEPTPGVYAHAAGLFVITPEGRVSRVLTGIDFPPRDLRLALVEAAEGKLGSTGDRLLLLCLQYDPATGRYSLTILRLLRIAAVLVVLSLAAFIAVALRRERRRRAAA